MRPLETCLRFLRLKLWQKEFFILADFCGKAARLTFCNKVLNLVKSCWPKKMIYLAKKSNVEKSKYSRHYRFIKSIAAVGVGARNLLCIYVEKRKPSIGRCFRKCLTQKLLLKLTPLMGNTIMFWFKIIFFLTLIYQLFLW